MPTKKTKILTSALAILLTTTAFTTANSAPLPRSHYQSCISLTTHFDQLKKQNHTFSNSEQLTFQNALPQKSWAYLSSYQASTRTLYLFQSPNKPQKQSLNIQNTKALSKLKLPAKRSNIQHFILQDQRLFITAEEGSQSTILIYSIEETRIKPFKTYYSTGKIKHIAAARENLFFLTETPLSQSAFDRLFKTQGEDSTILPKVESSLKFWLSKTLLDQAQCKKIAYHFPQKQGGSFFTLLNFQISDLQKDPKVNYFLGNLKELAFGQDYFYLLNSDAETTFAARFFRDPKLQLQASQSLSGQLLKAQSCTSKKNTLECITKTADSNYNLALWNEKEMKKLTLPTQTSTNENSKLTYHNAIFGKASLRLQDNSNQTFHFFPLASQNLQAPHTIKISPNQDFLLQIDSIQQLQSLQKILQQSSETIKSHWRNAEAQLFFLLTETPEKKLILKAYDLTKDPAHQQLFSRDYSKLKGDLSIQNLHGDRQRIAIDLGNYLDFFLFANPKATKTFRLTKV